MRIVVSCLLVLLLVGGWSGAVRLPLLGKDARIAARPVMLEPGDSARTRVGALQWIGGVALTSDDPAFGGFSALQVVGDHVTLLSDGGNVVRFRLGQDWRIGDVQFGNLPAGPASGWEKADRDSESLAIDPERGSAWVGFENSNSIWRYSADLTRSKRGTIPPAMRPWPENGGAESLVRLRSGGFLTISEVARWPHSRARIGIRFAADPVAAPRRGFRFGFLPPPGYSPSDMAELPDGRLLVLIRRFDLPYRFTSAVQVIGRGAIAPGRVVRGRTIARFAAPLIHDNFEGIAVTQERGATIVWLASDDNQSMLQRSLLLKFRLIESPRAR